MQEVHLDVVLTHSLQLEIQGSQNLLFNTSEFPI